jgi:hydroxymethylbilane synthase
MGWCDGLVMPGDEAEALRAGDLVVDHISMSTSLPLPGQGSAVIVARKDDEATLAALQGADDAKSRRCIEAERSIETRFQIAEWLVAVWVRSQTKKISAEAALIAQDGSAIVRDAFSGPHADFESMAQALTDSLSESAS